MAVFNPNVPDTQDPNYLNYFKPISDIPADKSVGIALEGAGKGLEVAVSATDNLIKKSIDDKIYAQTDKLRDEYTANLEAVRNIQSNSITADSTTPDLLGPTQEVKPPLNLESSLQNVNNLVAAKANGKINDTYYTQQLTSMVKGIRAEHPGYREYIDQKVSQVTGMNPANAYYKNLMEDVNRGLTQAGDERKQMQTLIRQNMELPNMPMIARLYDSNKLNKYDVMEYVNKYQSMMYGYKMMQTQREAAKGTREELAANASRDFTIEANGYVQNSLETLQLGTGTQSIEGARKFLDEMAQDPSKADPRQIQSVVTALRSKRDELAMFLKKRSNQLDNTGQSYASRMGGGDKVDEAIKSSLSTLDGYIDSINNKNFGVGTSLQRHVQAINDRTQVDLLENKEAGPFLQKVQALNSIAPQYSELFMKSGLMANIDKKLGAWLQEKRVDAATQPDFLSKGKVTTLKQHLDNTDAKNIGSNTRAYNNLFDIPKTIADPNAPDAVKKNIAMYAFSPENYGILDRIKMDYYDPVTKNFVPGKYSIFTRMSSPDITENMWKLRQTDPEGAKLWAWYGQWSENEFGKLFRNDISTLNDSKDYRVKFYWDSDNKRLGVVDDNGHPITRLGGTGLAATGSQNTVLNAVNRINSGLTNLRNIQEREGGDVSVYLLQQLQILGMDKDIAKDINQAIISSNKKNLESFEDTFFNKDKK